MLTDAHASNESVGTETPQQRRRRKPSKSRTKNLLLAADSAIDRLEVITRPGGEIESMDIKELKSLISSIRDLATVATELNGEKRSQNGGVIILPEVQIGE